jgi:hypothetical protein
MPLNEVNARIKALRERIEGDIKDQQKIVAGMEANLRELRDTCPHTAGRTPHADIFDGGFIFECHVCGGMFKR